MAGEISIYAPYEKIREDDPEEYWLGKEFPMNNRGLYRFKELTGWTGNEVTSAEMIVMLQQMLDSRWHFNDLWLRPRAEEMLDFLLQHPGGFVR